MALSLSVFSLATDEINQCRHAFVSSAFIHHAVVFLDLHGSKILELVFQQLAGVEVLHLRWSAGLVADLLRPVTFDEEEPAALERLLDVGKDLPAERWVGKLEEYRNDHIEARGWPVPGCKVGQFRVQ